MSDFSAQLSQVDAEIAKRTAQMFERTRQNEIDRQAREQDNKGGSITVSSELVQKLFVLRAQHDEVQSLISSQDFDASLEKLDTLRGKLDEFNQAYPNTLLAVDVHRKIENMAAQVAENADKQWNEVVTLTSSSLSVKNAYISGLAMQTGSSKLFADLDRVVMQPLLALQIDLAFSDFTLTWSKRRDLPSLDKLVANVRCLIECVAKMPEPLRMLIPRRFGAQLINKLRRQTLPKLYPNTSDPSDFQQQLLKVLPPLESQFLSPLWTHTSDLTQFAENFAHMWPEIRQDHYLMLLRKIYQNPITEESRLQIVDWYEEPIAEERPPKDEWDWDDDEEDDAGDESPPQEPAVGSLISLWRNYIEEVQSPALFHALYRALVPVAYESHDLWIYEDTCKFLSHIRALSPANGNVIAETEPLVRLCDDHLDRFVKKELDTFENSLLPALFRPDHSQEALTKILSEIDNLAMSVNLVGGPELRQRVLSLIVERVAVYVIAAVEQQHDIGDSESQNLSIIISRLNPLGVYFDEVAASVPSWTKMEVLRTLLTSNLASIGELLEQHQLLDFSPDELASLVGALFQDSSERTRLITRFYNTLR